MIPSTAPTLTKTLTTSLQQGLSREAQIALITLPLIGSLLFLGGSLLVLKKGWTVHSITPLYRRNLSIAGVAVGTFSALTLIGCGLQRKERSGQKTRPEEREPQKRPPPTSISTQAPELPSLPTCCESYRALYQQAIDCHGESAFSREIPPSTLVKNCSEFEKPEQLALMHESVHTRKLIPCYPTFSSPSQGLYISIIAEGQLLHSRRNAPPDTFSRFEDIQDHIASIKVFIGHTRMSSGCFIPYCAREKTIFHSFPLQILQREDPSKIFSQLRKYGIAFSYKRAPPRMVNIQLYYHKDGRYISLPMRSASHQDRAYIIQDPKGAIFLCLDGEKVDTPLSSELLDTHFDAIWTSLPSQRKDTAILPSHPVFIHYDSLSAFHQEHTICTSDCIPISLGGSEGYVMRSHFEFLLFLPLLKGEVTTANLCYLRSDNNSLLNMYLDQESGGGKQGLYTLPLRLRSRFLTFMAQANRKISRDYVYAPSEWSQWILSLNNMEGRPINLQSSSQYFLNCCLDKHRTRSYEVAYFFNEGARCALFPVFSGKPPEFPALQWITPSTQVFWKNQTERVQGSVKNGPLYEALRSSSLQL